MTHRHFLAAACATALVCLVGLAVAGEEGPVLVPPARQDQPAPGAEVKELPPPTPVAEPFGPGQFRLPLLPGGPGRTPQPNAETIAEYGQFVEKRVDPRNTLDLVLGRSTVLVCKDELRRVQLPDEQIASYTLLTGHELSVAGNKVGSTVLNLWFPDPADPKKEKILSYLVRVFPDPEAKERQELAYKALEAEINRSFPDSQVCLSFVGDKLVVSGQAKDIAQAAQIMRLVRSNAPRGGEATPSAPAAPGAPALPTGSMIASQLGLAENHTEGLTWGPEGFAGAGGPNVVNLLHVPGEQQVMLRVTVAEVNRAAVRSIGANFAIRNSNGLVFANTTGNIAGGTAATLTSATGLQAGASALNNLPTVLDNGQFVLAINALRELNLARSLAEPNLVTLNGQSARFQAGGQFPVPVVTGYTAAGLQGVSFVPFGVQLSFTPFVTDKDHVRLEVSADVSTRDLSAAANVGGTNVPGLSTRNFQTTVELREGQTLAVAGLIQNNYGADATRVPFFGDLPVIGRLAAFDRTSAGEQELVVLVTPELVRAIDPHKAPPLPGSDVNEPGDLEFYLLGRLESRRGYDYRSPVMTDIERMARYRHCDQLYIFGPQGHSDGRP